MRRFTWNNQSGMSLVEVMVAAALAGGLALVIAQLSKNSEEVSKRGFTKNSQQMLTGRISAILADSTACENTFSSTLTAANLASPNLTGATSTAGISLVSSGIKNKDNSTFISNSGKFAEITLTGIKMRKVDLTNGQGELYITGTYKLSGKIVNIKPISMPINLLSLTASGWDLPVGTNSSCNSSGLYDSIWMNTADGLGIYYNGGYIGMGKATPDTLVDIERVGTSSDVLDSYTDPSGTTYNLRPMVRVDYTPFEDATDNRYQVGIYVPEILNTMYGDVTESFRGFGRGSYLGRSLYNGVVLNYNTNWNANSASYGISGGSTVGTSTVAKSQIIGVAGTGRSQPGTPVTGWGADVYSFINGMRAVLGGQIDANPSIALPCQAAALCAMDQTTGTYGYGTSGNTYAAYFRGNVHVSGPAIEVESKGSGLTAAKVWATGYDNTDDFGAFLSLGKSRSTTYGGLAATAASDALGAVDMFGVNSSSNVGIATRIASYQDGAVGATYVPGKISFQTAKSTQDLLERMSIDNTGQVTVTAAEAGNKFQVVSQVNGDVGMGIVSRGGNGKNASLFLGTLDSGGTPNGGTMGTNGNYGGLAFRGDTGGLASPQMVLSPSGNLAVGYLNPTYKFMVNGDTYLGAQVGVRMAPPPTINTTDQDVAVQIGGGLRLYGFYSNAVGMYWGYPGAATTGSMIFWRNAPNPYFTIGLPGSGAGLVLTNTGDTGFGQWPGGWPDDTRIYFVRNATTGDTAHKKGGGAWSATSDVRLKKNIKDFGGAVEKLSLLRPVEFEWKTPWHASSKNNKEYGFIAQEMEKVFPEWVGSYEARDVDRKLIPKGEKVKHITLPTGFNAYVVKAIQELSAEIKKLIVSVTQLFTSDTKQNLEIRKLKDENEMLREELKEMKISHCQQNPKLTYCKDLIK